MLLQDLIIDILKIIRTEADFEIFKLKTLRRGIFMNVFADFNINLFEFIIFSINSIANHICLRKDKYKWNYSDTENITDLGTPSEFSSSTTTGNFKVMP